MRALEHDAAALRAQSDARRAADENLQLTQAAFTAGTAGYLDLQSATVQYQQARLAYLAAVAQRLQDTVALYAAVGGAWWQAGAPLPAAVAAP